MSYKQIKQMPEKLAGIEIWQMRGFREIVSVENFGEFLESKREDDIESDIVRILEYFSKEDAIYRAVPDDEMAPRFNDYAHLAR